MSSRPIGTLSRQPQPNSPPSRRRVAIKNGESYYKIRFRLVVRFPVARERQTRKVAARSYRALETDLRAHSNQQVSTSSLSN